MTAFYQPIHDQTATLVHAPSPDTGEEIANSGSHGLALLFASLAIPKLLTSVQHLGDRAYAGVVIFAAPWCCFTGHRRPTMHCHPAGPNNGF